MAGKFEKQLAAFGVKSMDGVDRVRRASVLELFKLIIYATPVDLGGLRGNWQATLNTPATAAIDRKDTDGGPTLADAMANLGGLTDVVWFTNNLPYAEKIELDGGLNKRGQGMVRKHVAQWRRIVEAKAKALG